MAEKNGKPNRRRKLLPRLCLVMFSTAATALVLEIAVRISGYSNQWIYDPIYAPFPASDDLAYIHKPNLKDARARDRIVIQTDSLGNRSLQSGQTYRAKQPDEFRIVILGDSLTFGHGLPQTADTFCHRLQERLSNSSQVKTAVFNFGASAYSVKEMAASLKHRALTLNPDLALMAIIPDDLDISRTPDLDRWGFQHNKKKSDWIDKDSRIKRGLRSLHSVYWIRDAINDFRHRGATPPPTSVLPAAHIDAVRHIRAFTQTARENGIHARVVLLPTIRNQETAGLIRAKLVDERIPHFDLTAITDDLSPTEYAVNRYNSHPSAEVHRRIAAALEKEIQSLCLIDSQSSPGRSRASDGGGFDQSQSLSR